MQDGPGQLTNRSANLSLSYQEIRYGNDIKSVTLALRVTGKSGAKTGMRVVFNQLMREIIKHNSSYSLILLDFLAH